MAKFAYWVGHSGQKFHLSSHRLIIATELATMYTVYKHTKNVARVFGAQD